MPVTHHDDLEVMSGDDWIINGALVNEDGTPTDLTTAVAIYWTLLGLDGYPILSSDQATVQVADPPVAGIIRITVPKLSTTGLDPGRYTDAVRVVSTTLTATFWVGQILVDADPWSTVT